MDWESLTPPEYQQVDHNGHYDDPGAMDGSQWVTLIIVIIAMFGCGIMALPLIHRVAGG